MTLLGRAGIAPAILLAVLTSAAGAAAQTNAKCAELSGNIVYGVGGSAQTPLIGQIASRVRGLSGADQLTVVYSDAAGACAVPKALAPSSPTLLTGAAWYWNAGNTTAVACDLDAAGVQAQFGSMQNFWEFCPDVSGARPASVGDFEGPIGTVNLIVPVASSQNAISAEAAHFVFGFGNQSAVEPWTDDNFIIIRNQNSAVQNYIAAAVDVPTTAFKGQDAKTNANSVAYVANVTNGKPAPTPVGDADQAIGFVSGENAERTRDKVRTLAYQHFGQECAYWPDSSATAFDKINVRRGQYYLWGTAHLFAKVSGSQSKVADITDEHVRKLVGWLTFTEEAPQELPVLDIYIDNYNVPQCAMQVRRSADLGPIESFQPDEPCGCYFELKATGAPSASCVECTAENEATACPSSLPKCRHGYCEVK